MEDDSAAMAARFYRDAISNLNHQETLGRHCYIYTNAQQPVVYKALGLYIILYTTYRGLP